MVKSSKVNTKSQRVRDAVLTAPHLIPVYLKDKSFNPKITTGIMAKMLPLRWGIEFECIGAIPGIIQMNIPQWGNESNKVCEFSQDTRTADVENEIRISGRGYTHLTGLYNLLQHMKQCCQIVKGGGIHIHINHSGYYADINKMLVFFQQECVLDKVYEIFGSQYKGIYNAKVAAWSKGSWVRITDNTIEFRIGELTFEYTEIVKILIALQSLMKQAINESLPNHLKGKKRKELIGSKYKYPITIA